MDDAWRFSAAENIIAGVSNPSYLRLLRDGTLENRVDDLERLLERCTVCPRDCLNNRLNDEIAACYSADCRSSRLTPRTSVRNHRSSAARARATSSSATATFVASIVRTTRSPKLTSNSSRTKSRTSVWRK